MIIINMFIYIVSLFQIVREIMSACTCANTPHTYISMSNFVYHKNIVLIINFVDHALPSNRSFEQIARYGEGIGHHNNYYGRPMMKGDMGQHNSYQT